MLGAGPFRVLGLVDHSAQSLPTGLLLHTEFGDREISELWLALADEPEEIGANQTSATCFHASGPGEAVSKLYS